MNLNDWILIGSEPYKVRKMTDDRGNILSTASLSEAVEILGLKELPESGEAFFSVNNEMEAKVVGERLAERRKNKE